MITTSSRYVLANWEKSEKRSFKFFWYFVDVVWGWERTVAFLFYHHHQHDVAVAGTFDGKMVKEWWKMVF